MGSPRLCIHADPMCKSFANEGVSQVTQFVEIARLIYFNRLRQNLQFDIEGA